MKALLYSQFGVSPEITDVPDPRPDPDGVVLEVKATGLCLSDWHGWMGHDPDISVPHIPGHELSGVVVETGKQVTRWKPGDQVTLPFVCGCGSCAYCDEGNPQVCDHQFQPGFTHWGSFAEYVAIKYADFNLVKKPDYLDFEATAILGCRFATAFRALVDIGKTQAEQWVTIFGCGGIGLSAIMIAKALDTRVVAVDINASKLEIARTFGADHVILASENETTQSIREITTEGTHISLDAVGKASIIQNSISCLRKGGRHIQIGLLDPIEKNVSVPFDRVISGELQLLGSHGMQATRYNALFQMIEKGKLDPASMITKRITLGESAHALMKLHEKDAPGVTVINDFTI